MRIVSDTAENSGDNFSWLVEIVKYFLSCRMGNVFQPTIEHHGVCSAWARKAYVHPWLNSLLKLIGVLLLALSHNALAQYTKVSNTGKALPDSAVLGTGANDWACTYDSTAKLIWEVKTSDKGLRDKDWTYSWYDSNSPDGNKGFENSTYSNQCDKTSYCNTQDYTQRVNTQTLCGVSDWRLPTNDELKTLVYCSSGTPATWNTSGNSCSGTYQKPTIDSTYFPNTAIASPSNGWVWSASVDANDTGSAWYVNFSDGNDNSSGRYNNRAVRLVRGGQSFTLSGGTPNVAPVASFTATPPSGNAPLTVNLDASASTDSDGNIATYAWSSSDGQTTNGQVASFTFNSAATPTITLTVTDDKGATNSTQKSISVAPKPAANKAPVAAFDATPLSGNAPLTVNLDASASTDSDGSIATYAWSSSDGQTTNGQVASFTFNSAATPTITLTVTDNQGATNSTQKSISVAPKPAANKAPVAAFNATPLSGNTPLTVNLDASASTDSDGTVATYAWSSSDAQATNGKIANLIFTQAGTFTLTLTVTDDKGATASKSSTITVKPATDTTPDSFSFPAQSGVALSTVITSNSITVSGINSAAPISITGGEYRINGGSWSTQAATVNNGQSVEVRHIAANSANSRVSSTLTIGGVSAVFESTTGAVPSPVSEGSGLIEGYVYDDCTGEPLSTAKLAFSSSEALQTLETGRYYGKLSAGKQTVTATKDGYQAGSMTLVIGKDKLRTQDFQLTPNAPCAANEARSSKYKAIILAGGGPQIRQQSNHLWEATQALADKAYRALRLQGFSDDNIRYLSAGNTPRYPDPARPDFNAVDDANLTLAQLESVLSTWAASDTQDVVIYLMSHGGPDTLHINANETLSPAKLDAILQGLQGKISGKLTLIMEACYSGNFVKGLKAPGRYLLASSEQVAAIVNTGGTTSFSYYFWDEVAFSGQLRDAFKKARQAMSMQSVGEDGQRQKAFMDTDGNGSFNQNDYRLVSRYCFGGCKRDASLAPIIESVGPIDDLNGQLKATLSVQAQADHPLVKAWVTVQRPDYVFPGNGVALTALPQVDLNCTQNVCQGDYPNFNLNGDYLLTFYVQDSQGAVSLPRSMTLKQAKRNDTREWAAEAVYDAENGLLTLRDVVLTGTDLHYYVELQDQGGYAFKVQYLQALTDATTSNPIRYDDSQRQLTIPKVYAKLPGSEGDYFAELMHSGDFVFRLRDAGAVK